MNFIPSPYKGSRNGRKIDLIVIHTMVGTYAGTISYFQKNDAQVSAHYCVDLTGAITQMVKNEEYSNHAGIVDRPSAKLIKDRPGINPNLYSIGIENADNGNPAGANRENQYPAIIGLVASLCRTYGIPADRDHIIGHKEIRASKTCPGNLNVDYIVDQVKAVLGGPMATELQTYLGVTDDTAAKARLKEHLGEKDGKCNWGAEGDQGGFLGSERKLTKTLLTNQSSVAVLLGLPANATNDQILGAINSLKDQANHAQPDPSTPTGTLLEEITVNGKPWVLNGINVVDNKLQGNYMRKG